jgi:hypothetical protein
MKTKTLIVILVITFILLGGVGGFAASKKTPIESEIIYDVLTGTWINRDYEEKNKSAKLVIHRDGSYDKYLKVNSEKRSAWSEYEVVVAWIDSEGTYWYRAITHSVSYVSPDKNEFGRIDTTKSVWEYVWSTLEIPEDWEWNPDNLGLNMHYNILYRQE